MASNENQAICPPVELRYCPTTREYATPARVRTNAITIARPSPSGMALNSIISLRNDGDRQGYERKIMQILTTCELLPAKSGSDSDSDLDSNDEAFNHPPTVSVGPRTPNSIVRRPLPQNYWDHEEQRIFLAERVFSRFWREIEPSSDEYMDSSGRPNVVFWDAIRLAYNADTPSEVYQRIFRDELEWLPGWSRHLRQSVRSTSRNDRQAQIDRIGQAFQHRMGIRSVEVAAAASEDEGIDHASESSNITASSQSFGTAVGSLAMSQLDGSGTLLDPGPSHRGGPSEGATRRQDGTSARQLSAPVPAVMHTTGRISTTASRSGSGGYRMIEAAGNSSTAMQVEALHLVRIAEAGITPVVRLPLEGEREFRRRIRNGLPPYNEDDIPITNVRLTDSATPEDTAEEQEEQVAGGSGKE